MKIISVKISYFVPTMASMTKCGVHIERFSIQSTYLEILHIVYALWWGFFKSYKRSLYFRCDLDIIY